MHPLLLFPKAMREPCSFSERVTLPDGSKHHVLYSLLHCVALMEGVYVVAYKLSRTLEEHIVAS